MKKIKKEKYMNLPKQTWQERFEKEFEGKPLYSYSAKQFCYYDFTAIKSFIAQILEEEKEKITKSVLNVIITCYGHSKGENIQGLCDYCTLELTKMLKK